MMPFYKVLSDDKLEYHVILVNGGELLEIKIKTGNAKLIDIVVSLQCL